MMKKAFVSVLMICFVQFLNIAWAADGDPALMGKTNVGNFTVKSATDSTTAVQVLDKDGTVTMSLDNVNNRVGIGTDAPGVKLAIGGGSDGAVSNMLDLSTAYSTTGSGIRIRLKDSATDDAANISSTRNGGGDYSLAMGPYGSLTNLTLRQSNLGLGQTTFGTSAAKTLAIGNGTAPTTSPADAAQIWSGNQNSVDGKARLFQRTEDGTSGPVAQLSEVTESVNPKMPSQAVHMTAASSGSSGIVVADNDNLDMGTGDFTLVWRGSLPDWTPSAAQQISLKYAVSTDYVQTLIKTTGALEFIARGAGGTASDKTSSVSPTFVDGTVHELTTVVVRETASTAGSVTFYTDGVQLGTTQAITAAVPDSWTNVADLYIAGSSSGRTASRTEAAYVINRAMTAAEVADMYKNGLSYADKYGSQTEQTSGTLVAGKRYRINDWITADDFTNVGGTNEDGNEFVAAGAGCAAGVCTPTTWTNSSTVVPIGATLALEPENIQTDKWYDASTNNLDASYPAAGASLVRPADDVINGYEYFTDGTDTSIIKHVQEPGLGGRLTIGLDETARTMVIADAGEVDVDFGLSAKSDPSLYILRDGNPSNNLVMNWNSIIFNYTVSSTIGAYGSIVFNLFADENSGSIFNFQSTANIEMTDTDGEQSWVYIEPKVNQSATAAYNGLQIKVTETALGDGSTGTGATNNLIAMGTASDPDKFRVTNTGNIIQTVGTYAMSATDVTCSDVDDTCAYSTSYQWHRLTSGADATGDTLTLPAGTIDGELRTFTLVVDGGDDVTIDVSAGTDTTLTTAGNSVDYMWDATNSTWWIK